MFLPASRSRRFPWKVLWTLALAAPLLGCSREPPTGEVSGTVTFKGEPVPQGTITFTAEDGRSDSSSIVNGKYKLAKAPVGAVKILVKSPPGATNPKMMKGMTKGMIAMAKQMNQGEAGAPVEGAQGKTKYVQIPSKYGNPATTDLNYEVKLGEQTKDVDLK